MNPADLAALVKGLKVVLDEYGFERTRLDAGWLNNILADYSPQTPALNRVAATVAREGFADLLRRATTVVESDAVVRQAVSRLVLVHAIEQGVAYDAVTAWATVLGVAHTRQRPSSVMSASSVIGVGGRLERKIQRLLDEAEAAEGRGDWIEAVDRYDEVLTLDPEHCDALQLRGLAERRRAKSLPELPSKLVPATSTQPGWPMAWMARCGEDSFGRWATVSIGRLEVRLRYCPPGEFLMGSADSESGRSDNEGPTHEVQLTRGLFLSETPCTQAQWEMVMGGNPSHFKGPDRPVETVSWDEAVEYCRKLTTKHRKEGILTEGCKWRLPTEAEWEYAARAGTVGPQYGDLEVIGWHLGNARKQTHPVKQKAANAWGFYDMLGNVWEWCSDWYGDYPTRGTVDPLGPNSGSYRVGRGGNWQLGDRSARSAMRDWYDPGYRNSFLSFRFALCST